jgi:hypothetical protein
VTEFLYRNITQTFDILPPGNIHNNRDRFSPSMGRYFFQFLLSAGSEHKSVSSGAKFLSQGGTYAAACAGYYGDFMIRW